FLKTALSPEGDPAPAIVASVKSSKDFDPALLDNDPALGGPPRVLILVNVNELTAEQRDKVGQFLASGGSVLVTLGGRVDAKSYNEHLWAGGQGWLPARLDRIMSVQGSQQAARPLASSFTSPALEPFRTEPDAGLADARLEKWWKVVPPVSDAK